MESLKDILQKKMKKVKIFLKKVFSKKYRKYLKSLEIQTEVVKSERMMELGLDPFKSIKKVDEKGW